MPVRTNELLNYSRKIYDLSILRDSEYSIFQKYKVMDEITLYEVFILTRVPC